MGVKHRLRVFETRVLGRIFEPKKDEETCSNVKWYISINLFFIWNERPLVCLHAILALHWLNSALL
jgi:hypothetical protein